MLSLILIIVVIVVVVMLSRKEREAREKLDYYSLSYRQGYWDGVRAAEQGVSSTNSDGSLAQAVMPPSDLNGQPLAPPVAPSAHRKDNHLTVNIALYVASLLLVGGISLFVRLFMPGSEAAFIWALVTAMAYYGFGFLLYQSMPILKPVAIAFVGTALAAMPYAGYLLHQSFISDASVCWLVASLVCLVAYFYAAVRLHSEIIGYAMIVILVSSADSLVSTLGASILWFIVAVMVVGAAITFISLAWPKWLPEVFRRPFIATQHVLVPFAVVWSLLLWSQLGATEYAIVFAVATLYYGAAALQSKVGSMRRTWLWALARTTLTIAAGFLTFEVTSSMYAVGAILAAIGIVQAIVSALHVPPRVRVKNQHEFWLWGGLALVVLASFMSVGAVGWAAEVTVELAGVVLIAAAIAWHVRRSEFLSFSVYGLTLLPLIGGYYLWHSVITDWEIVITYAVLTLLMPVLRWRFVRLTDQVNLGLVYVAQVAFSCMAVLMGLITNTPDNHWWLTVAFMVVTLAAYTSTWIEKRHVAAIVANSLAVVMLFSLAYSLHLTGYRTLFFTAAISFVGFYGSYLVLRYKMDEAKNYRTMWGSAMVAGVGLSLIGMFTEDRLLAAGFGLIFLVAGGALAYYDYEHRRMRFADIGLIVITVGLQRLLVSAVPGITTLLYSHWWAAVAFALAYLHSKYGDRSQDTELAKLYRVAALVVITLYGLWYAVAHGAEEWARIIFLLEHVVLVAYGLVRNSKLYTIWGAVGVTIAVLVMLPGFAFLLLPLLGLGIIAVVVLVIARNNTPPTLPK